MGRIEAADVVLAGDLLDGLVDRVEIMLVVVGSVVGLLDDRDHPHESGLLLDRDDADRVVESRAVDADDNDRLRFGRYSRSARAAKRSRSKAGEPLEETR